MSDLVDATLLVDALGDEPRLAPGIYAARAQDAAYGGLEALVVEKRATYLGERHDADGTKMIAVAVPGTTGHEPNMGGAIRIGREFFTTALRDYHDWKEKWWREAIQNSVDAGATEIDCRVEQIPEGFAISVSDDGRGMDEDTLLNKFLVLGGTTKTRGDTRGGFGKAKELLVLPWLAWSIHTRDRKVIGAGLDYQVEPAPDRQGTELRVVMPPDETTHESCAIAFVEKCYLPGIRFAVNGERYKAKLAPGEELRSFEGKASLYYDKKGKTQGLFVRTMGLFMFEMWVSDSVKGTLVVELTGSSVELLTANRDGIRDYELKRGIERYVNELAADVSSALKKKKGLIRERFEGTGKFTGANELDLRSAMLNHMEELQPQDQSKRGLVLSDEQVQVLQGVVHEIGAGEGSVDVPEETTGALNMRVNGETAAAMLDATVMPGPAAVEAAIKQLAWEPDFYLINEVEDFHVPKMFYPEGMTPGVKKLAKAWAELCRFVLIQLGCPYPFGVGFVFSHDFAAAFQSEGKEGWLLLNPYRNPKQIGSEKPSKEALWGLVDENDVNELYASAIHECTHMADGITYHDESFSSAFTRNVAKTANKDRQVKAIIKAIKARGPRTEKADRQPRAKQRQPSSLPPLRDEWLEDRRSETGREYSRSLGMPFVSFKNDSTSVWDYAKTFGELQNREADEALNSIDTYFEIRETATGKPVWRSVHFPEQFVGEHAANRAYGGVHASAASMDPDELLIGTEHELEHTDDPAEAKRIAMDHLAEDPRYYSRLAACGIDGLLLEPNRRSPPYLPLDVVERYVAEARDRGVSEVARSSRGFLEQYRRAGGDPANLTEDWRSKRDAFVARHMAQVRSGQESLIEHGRPSRRHLALIMWAYSPHPSSLPERLNPNAANRWGVDVRALNQWLKQHAPGHARVVRHRGVYVDIGAKAGTDLAPVAGAIEGAFDGVRADQPGMRNYLRLRYPDPDWMSGGVRSTTESE